MKRWILGAVAFMLLLLSTGCSGQNEQANITATTMPVYTFTKALCAGTPVSVELLVQENVSCLHDYTMTVRHMKMVENADLVIISGGGLEDFLTDALQSKKSIIDASTGIEVHDTKEHHSEHGHHHETDPHFWLSVENARSMAHTICAGLNNAYPQLRDQFDTNLALLEQAFEELSTYAQNQLSTLKFRELITFHDGFSYMAESFDLTILKAIEEESGSEASAKELIEISNLVTAHALPAIFVEKNGSDAAANVISNETGTSVFSLDMAMSGNDYFEAMRYNIDTLKEALG